VEGSLTPLETAGYFAIDGWAKSGYTAVGISTTWEEGKMSGKIIENLLLIKGWGQKPDDFSPVLSSCVVETGDIRPAANYGTTQLRYVLEVRVGIDLWANQAQLPSAVDIATRAFAKRMYGDIQGMVHEAMLQISNGDRDAAMKVCGMILDYTKAAR
jgi:hypothetical protein